MSNKALKEPGMIRDCIDHSPSTSRLTNIIRVFYLTGLPLVLCILVLAIQGCKKNGIPFGALHNYQETILVSDTAGFGAAMIDPNLVNAWGIAVAPSGPLWISTNGTGLSVIYNQSGMALRPPVTIPSADVESTGTPSGQVFNSTSGFVIPGSGSPAKFIFVAEDGTVSAWNGGNVATVVADRSASNAVYKGVEIASDGVDTFLYAADLHNARIDVFDRNFQYVPGMGFHDPYMPAGFAPFNIRDIGGWLYVTYAKQAAPDNHDDLAGPGNGFVDIFKPGGQFVKRFTSHGPLNSPWGIVQAQLGFSDMPDAILIGNFGDGRINVFDEHGNFFGSLKDQKGKDIVIDGLWAIQNNVPGADPAQLFFTAGPNGESHGLFGFIKRQ